jgi:hypothetical protein
MQTWMQKIFLSFDRPTSNLRFAVVSIQQPTALGAFFSCNLLKKSYHQLIAGIFSSKTSSLAELA